MSPTVIPAEERQLDLLLALRHSAGMSAAEIIGSVPGYDPDSPEAAHRMLERDKTVLRGLGIEITVTGAGDAARYRIAEADYALPPLRLTAEQASALDLAASAWRSGSLTAEARHALVKTRAVAEPSAGELVPGLSADLSGGDVPVELAEAVSERRRVAFDYASASSGTVRSRTVEPWRLHLSGGAWYLDGLDTAVGAKRTFRLSRLRSAVTLLGEPGAFDVPEGAWGETTRVLVACAPGRALGLRSGGRAVEPPAEGPRPPVGWDVIETTTEEPLAMAGSLAALGASVMVLGPASVRELVLAHLRGAAGLAGPVTAPAGEEVA